MSSRCLRERTAGRPSRPAANSLLFRRDPRLFACPTPTSKRVRLASRSATTDSSSTPSPGSDAFAAVQTSDVWRTLRAPPAVLRGVRVVLVSPKSPDNIGSVCRACANFECPDLWIVAPRTAVDPREDSRVPAVACGESVWGQLRVVGTLAEALADCGGGSVGLTRRGGATRATHESLEALERAFPGAVLGGAEGDGSSDNKVALVFGREESGLTESELRLCSHACAVPTGRVHASINLAAAVAVTLSWCFSRRLVADGGGGKNAGAPLSPAPLLPPPPNNLGLERSAAGDPSSQRGFQPASAREIEALLDKAAALAIAVGEPPEESTGGGNQGTHGRRRKAQGHLRAVLQRARVTAWEARSLHGYFSAALKACGVEDERAALEEARERRRREGSGGGGGGGEGGA
jgi:tRNA C32,U32 (ribose-2'-O)-methylase TrmJ